MTMTLSASLRYFSVMASAPGGFATTVPSRRKSIVPLPSLHRPTTESAVLVAKQDTAITNNMKRIASNLKGLTPPSSATPPRGVRCSVWLGGGSFLALVMLPRCWADYLALWYRDGPLVAVGMVV